MTVTARTGLRWTVGLLVLLLLVVVGLASTFKSAAFRSWLQAELSQRSGYDVRFAELGLEFPWSIVAGTLEVYKPGQLHFTADRLGVTITPLDLIAKTVHRVDIEKPVLQLDLQALTKTAGAEPTTIALRQLNVLNGELIIKNGDATLIELPNLDLNADNLNLDEQSGIKLRASVPALDGEAELHLKGRLRELQSDLVVRAQGSRGLLALPGTKTIGREILRLTAKLQMPENQSAAIAIDSHFQELPAGGIRLTGAVNGRAEIDQKFTAADFTGRTAIPEFAKMLGLSVRQLPGGSAVVDLAGVYSFPTKTLTVKTLQFSSPLGPGAGAGEVVFDALPQVSKAQLDLNDIPLDALKALLPAPWNRWAYHGRGQLTSTLEGPWNALRFKGVARSTGAQVRAASFTAEKFSFAAPFQWAESALRVQEAKIQATKLAYAEKERWQGAADKIDAIATVEYKPAQPLKISGRFDAGGGKFSSPDNATVGEGFAFRGPFEVIFDPTKNLASVTGAISTETGELLWGKFFGDLRAQKPVLDVAADYLRNEDRLQLRRASLRLTGIGQIDLAGAIEHVAQSPRLRLQLQSRDFSPGGFYDFFLRDTYNRQYPLLDHLAMRGRMAFDARLEGPLDAIGADGEFSLQAGELSHKSNDWQIGPIALTLPFQISLAKSEQKSRDLPRSGTLTVERARFARQSLAPIKTAISLTNNNLKFLQPVLVKIFGGEVAITTLSWSDLLNDPKRVSFSAELKQLRLEELTEALHWPRFSGTLTGSIPEVQSVENTLRTQGEIQAELFGGRVRIGKLEVENPFSSLASIKLDAKIDGIELEQLSKTFAFGSISGILEGSVEDLVLTDGQPAQMRADLRSVERSGVEQRISVEALNSITVLSSGQEAGALYGGLAGFFDSFRYSKLGFKATLKNDRLTLRGVQSEGDKEYLVVGSWLPPTVNIISHTQNIAFSELLRRLERIKAEKPEVKK